LFEHLNDEDYLPVVRELNGSDRVPPHTYVVVASRVDFRRVAGRGVVDDSQPEGSEFTTHPDFGYVAEPGVSQRTRDIWRIPPGFKSFDAHIQREAIQKAAEAAEIEASPQAV
jgi:hypothetical protein